MRNIGHHGVTAKHSSSKHASRRRRSRKHNARPQHHAAPAAGMNPLPVTVASPAKPRRLSPGIDLCPAEAAAAAARIAGWDITDEDVLDLYWRCADGPSSGFTIAAALTGGIAGKPLAFAPVALDELGEVGADLLAQQFGTWPVGLGVLAEVEPLQAGLGVFAQPVAVDAEHLAERAGPPAVIARAVPPEHPEAQHGLILGEAGRRGRPAGAAPADTSAALILGVDLPGPHAVTVAPDGCWVSWGEHYDPSEFPGVVIEEAWLVEFAAVSA